MGSRSAPTSHLIISATDAWRGCFPSGAFALEERVGRCVSIEWTEPSAPMPHVGLGGVPTPQDDASCARGQGDSVQYLPCQHALLFVRRH